MADVAELHQEAPELPVRQHNELIFQQFALACHLSQHPCHQLCLRPPFDRPERRGSLISRIKPNIQQYFAEEPLRNTSYKSAISSIHQDAVRIAIVSSSSRLFNGQPPPIDAAEQTLTRETITILAQLRTGHSRIHGQCMNRIVPTARSHCHNCGQSPHDTHHLFDCPSKTTTLTVESLRTAPTETAKHLNLAIDDPNGSCLFAAGSPTNTVGSQNFRTFSSRQITFMVTERPMPAMLLQLSASVCRQCQS